MPQSAQDGARPKTLGVIIPGRRPDGTVPLRHIEVYRYGEWLGKKDIHWIKVVNEITFSNGLHFPDDATDTGGNEILVAAAKVLAAQSCNLIVWACTCASFVGGLDWATRQMQAIERAVRIPATSTSLSIVAAIKHIGADTVDVLSPYPGALTAAFIRFLHDAGIETGAAIALDYVDPIKSHAMNLDEVLRNFTDLVGDRNSPVIIPDTAVDSLDQIAALEAKFKRPIVTANQATVWYSLSLTDQMTRFAASGTLWK
jgi:maleate isomerase